MRNYHSLLSFDDLLSVGAYADHFDPAFAKLFKSVDILTAYLGKLVKASAGGNIIVEALVLLVNRLAALKSLKCGGEVLDKCSVGLLVSCADLESVDSGKSIKLVDNKSCKTVYSYCVTHDNGVEPADSSGTACVCAVFSALVTDIVACCIKQLCGEGTLSYTGRISLCNAVDLVDHLGANACAYANAACEGV